MGLDVNCRMHSSSVPSTTVYGVALLMRSLFSEGAFRRTAAALKLILVSISDIACAPLCMSMAPRSCDDDRRHTAKELIDVNILTMAPLTHSAEGASCRTNVPDCFTVRRTP